MSIYTKLSKIQEELKAPKGQYNSFGNYNYRSCEDILEAVKPICRKNGCILILSDNLECIGGRYYVKSIATIVEIESGEREIVTAFAREDEVKKGMDGSQITGASSSYARKYALNGLFNIDDTKDSDVTNTHDKDVPKERKGFEFSTPEAIDYKLKVLQHLKEKGIDTKEYAKAHNLTKSTSNEVYKDLLKEFE